MELVIPSFPSPLRFLTAAILPERVSPPRHPVLSTPVLRPSSSHAILRPSSSQSRLRPSSSQSRLRPQSSQSRLRGQLRTLENAEAELPQALESLPPLPPSPPPLPPQLESDFPALQPPEIHIKLSLPKARYDQNSTGLSLRLTASLAPHVNKPLSFYRRGTIFDELCPLLGRGGFWGIADSHRRPVRGAVDETASVKKSCTRVHADGETFLEFGER
jgi:hypothetical protein